MNVLPRALLDLIEALSALPGVGPRSAERYAYFLLKSDPTVAAKISDAASKLQDNVGVCPVTFALIEPQQKISPLYSNPTRDKQLVCVVAESIDVLAIEKTSNFSGTYHVLGGLVSPIDNITPEQLHIKQLIERIDKDKVKEVIIATNASVEGESTALYIQKQLEGKKIKISRLARGLPVGVDLEYADQITLTRALEGRTIL